MKLEPEVVKLNLEPHVAEVVSPLVTMHKKFAALDKNKKEKFFKFFERQVEAIEDLQLKSVFQPLLEVFRAELEEKNEK